MASSLSMIDHYKELGVNQHATSADIRAAYKRLALLWHPDRNKTKGAEEKFKKIKQAYDILIDEKQKRKYDRQLLERSKVKSSTKNEPKVNVNLKKPYKEFFNQKACNQFMSAPIDPLDILNDIQFFQDSDFTSKMMNSPSYRNLYTQLFKKMNSAPYNNRHTHSSSPIFLNNDRLFRPTINNGSKNQAPHINPIAPNPMPVIHSTMPNDWFLNELIDLCEQQNLVNTSSGYSPYMNDTFFDDLTHCTHCHKNISADRSRLMQHEQQCRQNTNRHSNMPPKSLRV